MAGIPPGLLNASMRSVRTQTVREFFALVNQHMRWELNDLPRRLYQQPALVEFKDESVPAAISSSSVLTPNGRRICQCRDRLEAGSVGAWYACR